MSFLIAKIAWLSCVCVMSCLDTCVHTHLLKQCETYVAVVTTRDEGKEENKTHKFFHADGEAEWRLNLAADLFKTMGFNSHIRLFCSHWHGLQRKTQLKDKTASAHLTAIVSVFLVLVS